jgi:membrane dipeptidase
MFEVKKVKKNIFSSRTPEGLKDVKDYPNLFVKLLERNWKEPDLAKIAGGNIIRVLQDVEKVIYLLVS